MGIWNSHTSVGNILGSLIAGIWVSSKWGLSFIVPGIIIAAVGVACFFFLVEREWWQRADTQHSAEISGTTVSLFVYLRGSWSPPVAISHW